MLCRAVIPSPLPGGLRLALHFSDSRLVSIDFVAPDTPLHRDADPAVTLAIDAVRAYFEDPHRGVTGLPLVPPGTPFQRRVWQALCAIPVGETRTYGELARQLHSSARAVAGACRDNPIPLLIPCHRVVAANGPGGYMGQREGAALAIKQWLLHHEHHARG